jgi:hypothetical protein
MVATASVIHARSSSIFVGRSGKITLSLVYPQTDKSRGVKSGDRGGNSIVPSHPIQTTTVQDW